MPKPRREIIIDKIYDEFRHNIRREFIAEVIRLFTTNHGIRPLLAKRRSFKIKYLGKFTPIKRERERWNRFQLGIPERIKKGMNKRDKRISNRRAALNEQMIAEGLKPYKCLPRRMTRLRHRLMWKMPRLYKKSDTETNC